MYIALDGDSIGRKIEGLILTEKLEDLVRFSQAVDKLIDDISRSILENDGTIYLSGGDNILAFDPRIESTIDRLKMINSNGSGIRFSVGYGESIKLAYLGLKYAKQSNGIGIVKFIVKNGQLTHVIERF